MTSMNFGDITRYILNNLNGDLSQLDTTGNNGGGADGKVSLSEFKNYFIEELGDSYNENKDIIKKYFNNLNTNTKTGSKLDSKEIQAAERIFEIYAEIDDILEGDLEAPNGLSATLAESWENSVLDDIYTVIDRNISKLKNGTVSLDDLLTEEFLTSAKNKHAVLCYQTQIADELKKEMLSEYPNYKPADDAEIDKIIKLYMKNMSEVITYDQIENDLTALIEDYYNLAVGPTDEDGETDLDRIGYRSSGLNDLQVEVAKAELKTILEEIYSDVEPEILDKTLDKYIQMLIKNASDFTTLMNRNNEDELDLGPLDALISAELWRDFDIDTTEDSIYSKVLAKVDNNTELADTIANDERYVKEYNDAIEEGIKKIESGEIKTQEEFEQFILNKIMQNLTIFISQGDTNELSIAELGDLYDKSYNAANAVEDSEESLKLHRQAAITYCDALAAKGDAYKEAIEDVFGSSNYKSVINKTLPTKLNTLIEKLKTAVAGIVIINNNDGANLETDTSKNANWTGLMDSYTVAVGQTLDTFEVSATYDTNTPVDNYVVDVQGSAKATIDALGNISITGASAVGVTTVTVYAVVANKKIGSPKTFTIKTNLAENISKPGDKTIASDSILTSKTGALRTSYVTDSLNTTDAKNLLESFVDLMADDLITSKKYTSSKVNAAAEATKSYFTSLIDALTDKSGCGYQDHTYEVSFNYKNAHGQDVIGELAKYRHIQDDTEAAANDYGATETQWEDQSGIAILENVEAWIFAKNKFAIHIDKQKVVQKFIEFFNTLL